MGGLFTLLEILNVKQIKDEDKQQAVRKRPVSSHYAHLASVLLQLDLIKLIADNGRVYKELICQSYGIRAIAECMAKSSTKANTQKSAQVLLDSLAHGNPTYTQQVYKGLIAILLSTSPKAQELSASLLCKLQPQLEQVHPSLLEPVIGLLQSFYAEVQYQAIELIKILMSSQWNGDGIATILSQQLITCLQDATARNTAAVASNQDLIDSLQGGAMPIHIQQAAACKCIRSLTHQYEQFLRLQIVHHLLRVMGNESYPESQRQASLTLHAFVERYSVVYDSIIETLGEPLFDVFYQDPDGFYSRLTPVQADVCRTNLIHMSFEDEESN